MSELLALGPLNRIRVDLTTRCNLRCVYCAVSQSTYRGIDMPSDMAHRTMSAIAGLTGLHQLDAIHINGHGETTYMEGWVDLCRPLLDRELPLVMTTNLAKTFSTEELEVLARMSVIAVSIDTCDQELLRRMRRKVDLRQIVTNINLIRAASLRLDQSSPPVFEFSCGLYDKNTLLIEDFARFAVALGIQSVGFWNLSTWKHEKFPYENTDVPELDRAYPLDDLPAEDLRPRIAAVRRAITILNANGVVVEVNGDFIETLEHPPSQVSDGGTERDSLRIPKGMTRDCLDPWTYFEVDTNGDVKPCCARGSVGSLVSADLSQILEGEPIRRLRADLLNGTPDLDCVQCPLRGSIEPAGLKEKVRSLYVPEASSGRMQTGADRATVAASLKVTNLLSGALEHLRKGQRTTAWSQVCQALAIDPPLKNVSNLGDATIRTHIQQLVSEARFPSTLSGVAAICREIRDRESAMVLMQRYLEMAPHAPDRHHVREDLRKERRLMLYDAIRLRRARLVSILNASWLKFRVAIRLRTRARLAMNKLTARYRPSR